MQRCAVTAVRSSSTAPDGKPAAGGTGSGVGAGEGGVEEGEEDDSAGESIETQLLRMLTGNGSPLRQQQQRAVSQGAEEGQHAPAVGVSMAGATAGGDAAARSPPRAEEVSSSDDDDDNDDENASENAAAAIAGAGADRGGGGGSRGSGESQQQPQQQPQQPAAAQEVAAAEAAAAARHQAAVAAAAAAAASAAATSSAGAGSTATTTTSGVVPPVLPSPAESHDSAASMDENEDEQTWLKNIRPFTPLVGQRSYGEWRSTPSRPILLPAPAPAPPFCILSFRVSSVSFFVPSFCSCPCPTFQSVPFPFLPFPFPSRPFLLCCFLCLVCSMWLVVPAFCARSAFFPSFLLAEEEVALFLLAVKIALISLRCRALPLPASCFLLVVFAGRPCTPDTIEEGRPFTPSNPHFDIGGLAAMEVRKQPTGT
eukprot:COSAG06_NODE_2312_length_7100_cov_7.782609_1_plen_425_part_10